jgi:hypothetical protein
VVDGRHAHNVPRNRCERVDPGQGKQQWHVSEWKGANGTCLMASLLARENSNISANGGEPVGPFCDVTVAGHWC